ncbi:hypothetical protein [Oceanobacillus caeni]|uniref:hypothetical protein n=1 Tax=Oceanobacillus caeni TaxID=405946 RepID=UPI00362B314B
MSESLEEHVQDLEFKLRCHEGAVKELNEENERYKQALKFYADKKTYDIGSVLRTPIGRDCGKKARQALEGESE